MQHVQFKKERRRFLAEPRAQILAPASALLGTTELAYVHGLKYPLLLAFGFIELDRDGDHVLMKAPAGWESESPTLSGAV